MRGACCARSDDQRDLVAAWLREVDGPRRAEALESLAAEGVSHETAMLIDTSDGPVIVYAMETDGLAHSKSVTDQSPRSIDAGPLCARPMIGPPTPSSCSTCDPSDVPNYRSVVIEQSDRDLPMNHKKITPASSLPLPRRYIVQER